MTEFKFKKGDMAKVVRAFRSHEAGHKLTWMPEMCQMIGKIGKVTYVAEDGDVRLDDAWWFYPFVLEHVGGSRTASILTEKVLINDIPCRKILGFEGILGRDELPKQYLEGSPMFCNEGVKHGHGHFEFNGKKLRYFGSEDVTNIDIKVPCGKPPEVDIGYFLMMNEGDIWPETTFQNILVWLKRAGSRLAKIRKQEKAAWGGKETVEI
jgi:hypothetical protein